MNLKNVIFKKTAAMSAVFCFLLITEVNAQVLLPREQTSLETVKKKAVNLLMQSQKKQALSVLGDYISKENNRARNKEFFKFMLTF